MSCLVVRSFTPRGIGSFEAERPGTIPARPSVWERMLLERRRGWQSTSYLGIKTGTGDDLQIHARDLGEGILQMCSSTSLLFMTELGLKHFKRVPGAVGT